MKLQVGGLHLLNGSIACIFYVTKLRSFEFIWRGYIVSIRGGYIGLIYNIAMIDINTYIFGNISCTYIGGWVDIQADTWADIRIGVNTTIITITIISFLYF